MPPRNTKAPPTTTAINEKAAAAGYAAIIAYGKQEETLSGEPKAALHLKALDSSLRFAHSLSRSPGKRAGADSGGHRAVYRQGLFARDCLRRKHCLRKQPPVDAGKQRIAWTVIGNSNFDQGVFDKAEAAYTHAQALMAPNDPERSVIVERLAASIYKQGEQKSKAGDSAAAVDDFLRVASSGADIEGPGECRLRRRGAAHQAKSNGTGPSRCWKVSAAIFRRARCRRMSRAISRWPIRNRIIPARRPPNSNKSRSRRRNRRTCSAKRPCRRRISTTRPATRRSRAPCSRPS